jgi:hypothetical protein
VQISQKRIARYRPENKAKSSFSTLKKEQRAEFSLTALAYNLRRALNILGVDDLMKAVQA